MSRINLPSGNWVDLDDPAQVTERYLKPLRSCVFGMSDRAKRFLGEARKAAKGDQTADLDMSEMLVAFSPEDEQALTLQNELGARALIVGWSFNDQGVHPELDAFNDLTGPDYAAVLQAVAPFAEKLLLDLSPTPENAADASSPTVPSNA